MMKRRVFRIVVGLTGAAVAIVVVFVGCVAYVNWSAEKRAREFCSRIPVGSDISSATSKANDGKILWGSASGYTFYFSGFIFDKAVCEVSVDKAGKVISKNTEMEYD